MSRPKKQGMDYFPHDVDASNDEKIEALRAIHGNDGYAFFFILLERIYRTANAELDVSKPAVLAALVNKVGVSMDKFNDMLQTAFDIGCFNRELFEKESILTSKGIKRRASEVTSLRDRWRKQKENPAENPAENAEVTGESKLKEIKEKKIKEKENKNTYSPVFETFWVKYPRKEEKKLAFAAWNARLKEGFTEEQLLVAEDKYLAKCKADKTELRYIKMPKTLLGPGGHIEEHLKRDPPQSNVVVIEGWGDDPDYIPDYVKQLAEAKARGAP